MKPLWLITYDSDTGPNDDYFDQWWTVSDGKRDFRCGNEEDAKWLLNLLQEHES